MWITVSKGKGGAGCTVTVLELAYACTVRGLSVAVLDLDHQASASAALEPEQSTPGIRQALDPRDPLPLRATLTTTAWPGILLAPADRYLANRDTDMRPDSIATLRKARRDGEIDDLADVILIDAPRDLGRVAATAYLGGETLLLVSRPTLWSAQGIEEARYSASLISQKGNPELRFAGILLTDFDKTADSERVRSLIRDQFPGKLLDPPVPHNPMVREAIESYHMPSKEYGGADDVADVYQKTADRLIGWSEEKKT